MVFQLKHLAIIKRNGRTCNNKHSNVLQIQIFKEASSFPLQANMCYVSSCNMTLNTHTGYTVQAQCKLISLQRLTGPDETNLWQSSRLPTPQTLWIYINQLFLIGGNEETQGGIPA